MAQHFRRGPDRCLQLNGTLVARTPGFSRSGGSTWTFYVAEPGVRMRDAKTFDASAGGCPTNIAMVAQRLGINAAVLTATGNDLAGELVRRQLSDADVDISWVRTIAGAPTSMAILAQPSPDEEDVLLLSGDAMAAGTTPSVVPHLISAAIEHDIDVWWDLDLRPSSWPSLEDFARAVKPALSRADVVIGTEAEFTALVGLVNPTRSQIVDVVNNLLSQLPADEPLPAVPVT